MSFEQFDNLVPGLITSPYVTRGIRSMHPTVDAPQVDAPHMHPKTWVDAPQAWVEAPQLFLFTYYECWCDKFMI